MYQRQNIILSHWISYPTEYKNYHHCYKNDFYNILSNQFPFGSHLPNLIKLANASIHAGNFSLNANIIIIPRTKAKIERIIASTTFQTTPLFSLFIFIENQSALNS